MEKAFILGLMVRFMIKIIIICTGEISQLSWSFYINLYTDLYRKMESHSRVNVS
jgi:hypothetical protein